MKTLVALLFILLVPFAHADAQTETLAAEVFVEVNAARAAYGLPLLTSEPYLAERALWKATDLAVSGRFSHENSAGTMTWDTFDRAEYAYMRLGENLAMGFTDAGEIVDAWLASPTHRAVLLQHDYTDLGIGEQGGYVAALFGNQN